MKGAIALVGAQTIVPFQEVAPAKRNDDLTDQVPVSVDAAGVR
jgi:hypothetical protein